MIWGNFLIIEEKFDQNFLKVFQGSEYTPVQHYADEGKSCEEKHTLQMFISDAHYYYWKSFLWKK